MLKQPLKGQKKISNQKQAVNRYFLLVVLGILTAFSVMGCGRKAMPKPPLSAMPSPPSDLSFHLDTSGVTLEWRHTGKNKDLYTDRGFEIFRAEKNISGDACVGCPIKFKKRGSVDMTAHTYSEDLERGYRYYYRIRFFAGKNIFSRYSETIQFEFK
ncbi:MAG: hypothetical protein U9P10_14560 [Thermodesulfobacteriota bacterium]|nr:hypothetical protein [Thermodesulfobacteriota bacterium]